MLLADRNEGMMVVKKRGVMNTTVDKEIASTCPTTVNKISVTTSYSHLSLRSVCISICCLSSG